MRDVFAVKRGEELLGLPQDGFFAGGEIDHWVQEREAIERRVEVGNFFNERGLLGIVFIDLFANVFFFAAHLI